MILLNRKVLILTFCSIGCFIHLFTVVNEFLKFPVRTDIIYEYPDKMIVPEIDIFLYNIDLFNVTELYLKYQNKMTDLCKHLLNSTNTSHVNFNAKCIEILSSYYESSYYVGRMLTIGDVEKLNVQSLNYRFKYATFVRNDICSIKKYFNAVNTFIRVSCREDSKQVERRFVRNIVTDDRFCIQHNIFHRFGVRFAHPNTIINPALTDYVEVEREAGENVFTFLRYRETIIENSEWPYQTNCRHYQKEKILIQCLREKIFHSYPGMVQFDDVVEVGQFPSNLKFDDLKYQDNETFSQFINECSEQLEQLQCTEKTYQTRGKTYKEKGLGKGLICLENQIDFNIHVKTYPQSTFTELLIYISSILGIWFGISIYGKLLDGFVFPTIATKTSEPITSKVGPSVDISTITEEHQTV